MDGLRPAPCEKVRAKRFTSERYKILNRNEFLKIEPSESTEGTNQRFEEDTNQRFEEDTNQDENREVGEALAKMLNEHAMQKTNEASESNGMVCQGNV